MCGGRLPAQRAFFRDLGRGGAYISAIMTNGIKEIFDDFEFLEDWEDRYRYVIDLGQSLPPFPDSDRNETTKVRGCVSQVWLVTRCGEGADPVVTFAGDSDAHIVKGLVAIVLALFSGRRASEIIETDAEAALRRLGLDEHLTPQRSNGLRSMIKRIKHDAALALENAGCASDP